MAKLQVSDYRARIREIIDLDESDLSNTMLDLFITQGMRYAQRWNQGLWPFYENRWTYELVAGTHTYTHALLESNDGNSYTIAHVRDARTDDLKQLVYLSRSDFEQQVKRDNTTSGEPRVWTPATQNSIRFWPTPDANTEVDLYGWREPTNWVAEGAGGVSDMPEDFDDAILYYALGQTYAQQDEGQTSVYWLNMADVVLVALEDKYDQLPPVSAVMNGRPGWVWESETLGRLPFDFEL